MGSRAAKEMMPTSLVGRISKPAGKIRRAAESGRSRAAGVTLLELLIVMTLMGLLAGLSYPSMAAGIDSLRLRSASNGIVGFFNTAIDRAQRRQQVVEITIIPRENAMVARTPDLAFYRRFELADSIRIVAVEPRVGISPDEPQRFLCYPGGTAPRVRVEIANPSGRRRMVSLDPITGVPQAELISR
jgi:prepilin-type N-terminal cleavage/methylation domain-containing protein